MGVSVHVSSSGCRHVEFILGLLLRVDWQCRWLLPRQVSGQMVWLSDGLLSAHPSPFVANMLEHVVPSPFHVVSAEKHVFLDLWFAQIDSLEEMV